MKKVLLGAFYTLQGLCNLILGWQSLTHNGTPQIVIPMGLFLVFASCLSLFAALTLFLRREVLAESWGIISSFLFILFYGWIALISYSGIMRHYYSRAAIVLLLSMVIVVLNAASILSLYEGTKK